MEVTTISQAVEDADKKREEEKTIGRRKKCKKCKKLPIWTNELHGLGQLLRARTWYERIFWFVVISVCLSSALWFSRILFSAYLQEQTVTLNSFKTVEKMKYPHIVLCPKQADSLQYDELRHDMTTHLSYVDEEEYFDLLDYVVAGSGIHGLDNQLKAWDGNYTDYLYDRVKLWRGNRTWDEFFSFVFDTNGYKCEELFENCLYGYYEIPCCEVFKPLYVLNRGRCFRLDDFYQTDEGDLGQLEIHMRDLPSNFFKHNGTQRQLVLYLSNSLGDVLSSPRLYLSRHTWNEIRYQMKQIQMLPEREQQCSLAAAETIGITRCAINTWLTQQLINPFNCTFYPFHTSVPKYLKTCDPHTIIQNYKWIFKSHVSTTHCVLACERDDIREQKFTSTPGQTLTNTLTPFMLQIQYSELRVEIYQEVHSTSVPGFISELGGQVMLYLGVSLNTVVQTILLILHWCRRQYYTMKGK